MPSDDQRVVGMARQVVDRDEHDRGSLAATAIAKALEQVAHVATRRVQP